MKQPTLNMMLQGMAAAAAGHPGSLHHALQSPPNSNAAAINPAGGFLFLPQNPNAGMQGQQMHPGTNKNNVILIKEFFIPSIIKTIYQINFRVFL